ncbi:T9SS type A sorting domain-containing protein [Pseudoflavitalea sp. X16]|uniref:LamG-like jellyroll fold domain-containing protein n=1 Tax=Paraflavitalea devenefica TaxID=2716334 RepID=UPI00142175EE|nr:LamG-like jellyroll fold domain-containing protein [Paraflavitalea devenefica]NII27792.1 T9SS type A sorting domain-containing protein [Paraflavitalea devenefica]
MRKPLQLTLPRTRKWYRAFLIVLMGMLVASKSMATTYTVTNLLNTGAGSLRQAILNANADASGPHTIVFSVSGVINITTTLPAITRQVTMDGGNTITISGPGGDNYIGLITLGAGSGGSTIKNLVLRNTGLEPVLLTAALSGITLEKLTLSQTGTHYANHGIMANGAVTNMTIKNVTITGTQDNYYGILFNSTVTNMMIDGYKHSGGGGGSGRALQFLGVVNGATIKNCLLDMDDPATTDDGDYSVIFNSNASNITIDSSTFRDAEIYPLYFKGNATFTNITVKNSTFDNLDGGQTTQMLRFETTTNVNTLTIDKNVFNADFRNTTNDGDYGIVLGSVSNQNINITNNTFLEHDGSGLHVAANHAANTDNLTIKGNTFTRNGQGTTATGGMRIYVRNATSDVDSVRITENTFNTNNGEAIGVFAASNVASTVAKFLISKNTIYSTQSSLGAIYVQQVSKVVISQNSIYNNVGLGIQLVSGGNCSYEGANTPQLLSSTETTPGVYTISVKMPAICGSGNCSLELFSNAAKVTGVGGQHYVTTRTGLASGTQTLTGVSGSFPEINAAPYGTWSATLKLNNNCGTSEFSNKIRVKVVGPAGVNSGIKLWLRGDEILSGGTVPSASGQLISGWDELSGGGGPSAVTIVNNPLTKLNGINFNPVADMDGDLIRGVLSAAPSWITSNAITSVGVFNPQSISASNDRFFVLYSQSGVDYNTNAAQIEFWRNGTNIQSYRGNTVLNPPTPGTTGVKAFDRPGVFTSLTSATNHTAYYNGASLGSGAYNKGNFAISQWFVGGGYGPNPSGAAGNTWYYMGETDFAEVFTYNRTLTAAELQKVQSYMALKYGIAMKQNYLLSNGTLVWDVTANAAYSKEIAALVKDDVSILEQKQAKAFHTDEVATIGIGSSIAATNKDNEGEITNDLSVLIWGNDSASTAFTQTFTGTFANTRMVRKWKVQKTNWADQDITVKLTNGKLGNYLLISTDPTFATVSQELPLNNEGTVTLSSALLTDGVYFTFGRQQKSPGGVLTSLDVWAKADNGVTLSGANAVSWEDQGSSMRIWNRINTNALPWSPAAMNYNPVITFPGPTNANYFNFPQFTNTYTQGEVFSVQSSAVNNVEGFPWQLGGNSGTTVVWYRYTNDNMYLHFGTNARRNFAFTGKNMALPVILNVNTAANSWTASLDGKVYSGPAAYTTSFAQTGPSNALGVGYGSYFNGPVSEVILYKRKLNATERQQVNSYMALRYGITLDQTVATDYLASDGVTTMWDASDNGTYKNNIAGIGRDENGTLLQKQSRSINTAASGNLVTVAVGSELAASNAENTDTITNDRSFFTWADNNGAVTYATPVTGEKVTFRMARVWKVDKTNWADRDITIKLHGSISNGYLLISNSDATFATFDQELPINADSTITIGSDLLPDGAYFTFAKELKGPGFVNAGIQLWLRADDGTSVNNTWFDYSGNDIDAQQATAANQPALTGNAANFNPAFRFDGTDDYMDFASNLTLTGTNPFTVVGLGLRETIATWDGFLSQQGSTTGGFLFGIDAVNKNQIHRTGTGTTLTGTATNNLPNFPYLVTGTRSGNNFALYNNGGADGTITSTHSYNVANVRLGNRLASADVAFAGKIPEVVVYNRALTAAELQRVHSYLGFKYGITLNNGATDYVATDGITKMWTVSKNTGYTNNIAGIGRDDKTALFQKQSRSASDTLVTIAAGSTVAADNASNTTDINDLSFFTWADNGGAATFSVAVTSVANATSRMARVWKVDRTNWNDQDITVKLTPGGERYLLVHATDPAFGAGTVEYAINTMSSTVTINTADLPDGAFFTIGTKIVGPGCVNNGIATWLRADYAAAPNSWVDFSGNQTNAAQATTANQPDLNTAGLNYHPSLTFNGTTDNLVIPNASITGKYSFGANARTVIGVGATSVVSSTYGMMFAYGSNGGGTGLYLGQASGTSVAGFGGYNSPTYNITGTANSLPVNNTRILGGRYTGTVARLDVNGALNTSLTTTWNTTAAQPAYVGLSATTNSQYWNGKLGEIIVYNRELTAPELQRVNSYLALKYGITLNQTVATDYIASDGTTRMWTAADNTGYNIRITGIGRDDCTNLYQKQSLSTDTGIVAIAMGDSVATSNFDNANTIINDNSYLVFADNGGATQYTTAISGLASLTTRMPRTWKVDKTNFADTDISFKLTGGNDKVYLIVSATDNVFDGADVAYQLDATGTVLLSSADLPDGAYFSFAKELNGPGYVNVGVQLWLRADDGVSTVDNWNDYSGNDNHATQATAASQPVAVTNSVNYNPAFDFDGTDDYMDFATNAGISGTSLFTLASVQVRGTATTQDAIIAQQGAITNAFYNSFTGAGKYVAGNSNVGSVQSTGTYSTANIPYLTGITRSAGNLFSLYNNGNADGALAQAYTFLTNNLRLGNRATSADLAFDGNINEVVVYNRTLSAAELRQVNAYLALKYGITMSGDYIATDGTTSYWTAANNTGYLNNIAGIGRDDNTDLYQKQSRSVNTTSNGNMVAMGLTSIATTNKDNTSTLDDDLSFLVWGDNGLSNTQTTEYPVTLLNPSGCSRITRLQREWKVQKTGTVNDLQLKLFLAGQVPSSTTSGDLKLLIDDDGDFGNGGTSVIDATTYDAATQQVTFDNTNFNNGQYFTLVTDLTNQAPGGVTTNLYTWYRGDKGVTLGTGVSAWTDQSASGKDATQATTGAQPVYNTTSNLINFNPTLSFDGTNDVLNNNAISYSGSSSDAMFAVVLPDAVAGNHNFVGLGTSASSTNSTEFRFVANKLAFGAGAPYAEITNPTTSNGIPQIAAVSRAALGSSVLQMNGTNVASGSVPAFPTMDYLNIGARRYAGATDQFFKGRMAEAVIYMGAVTPPNRAKIISYLAIKYGITLAQNYVDPAGTVVWNTTTNTGYGFNITGIGRDDCNGLHQKQSKSVNATEALVTVGHGLGINTTNAGNTNVMENNTALLLGDDNAARATFTATGAPAGRERIARTWKVQETGTIGTVTIQVPANSSAEAVKLPLERDGIVYLLVNSTTDFTTGAIEVPMTLNGTNWETTYDFSSGDYFTFATNDLCVTTQALLTNYNAETIAAPDKCYVNGWILFRDPVDASKYIAAIYDPTGLINRTLITARVDVDAAFADLGKGDAVKAARLMRRLLQVDCSNCYDAVANPTPGFIVRMFYAPDEKAGAESVETNSMESLKTANGLTDAHFFKWFKASGKTAAEVVSGLTAGGIAAGGQEWADGVLPTGLVDGTDYIDFTGINSFSTFGGIWLVNLQQALPVTWLNVQATPVNNEKINIKWSTAMEMNNAFFEVERSDDGGSYRPIAKVPGKVNSNTVSHYAVDDQDVAPGVHYSYRIRQVNLDGRGSYSKVVTATLEGAGIQVRVMPNPVQLTLQVEITAASRQQGQLVITDAAGKVLEQQKLTMPAGKKLFTTDVSRYSNGNYFIRVLTAGGEVVLKKFIIQKGL